MSSHIMMTKTSSDYTLNWMYRNLPPEEITLANYITINRCADKTLEDLEGEELAYLPKELYPEPATNLIQ
jgi:hypothetical protein